MAEKQGEAEKQDKKGNILVSAAKALGTAAGSIASVVKPGSSGEHAAPEEKAPAAKAKPGKLPKTGKSRLPRKEKKAQKKAATRTASNATASKTTAGTAVPSPS